MMDRANTPARINLRSVALATAVVVGVASTAAVAYLLLDVLLLLFIGIIVAAALQPWHVLLNQRGIPKGFAVLMIYVLILTALVSIAIVVGPLIIEQVGTFTDDLPRSYAAVRAWLTHSSSGALEFLGARMPPFERLAPSFSTVAPELYKGTLGVTVGLVKLGVYFVSVFAIGFYWTIEVARFERLIVSLLPVAHRTRALTVWHEIESKLGGFMRGQGMAMLFVGAVSGIGYALIGLPNAIPLGILAGLFEAVPLIGPILAVGPAVLVSLSVGGNSVFAVLVLAAVVHLFESNVLIPRIMHRAVGVSYLVSLLALLAFGTLYGIIGVLIAVPMAAVIQVVLDTLVISAESVPVVEGVLESPADELRARVQALRQHARVRLRARSSRMGIDPSTTDHLVDAVDQQIEAAAAHIDRLISVSEDASQPVPTAAIMEALHGVTEEIEHAVEQVDETITEEVDESLVADLNHATERFQAAITQIEKLVVCEPKSDPTAKLQPLASRRPGIPPRAA